MNKKISLPVIATSIALVGSLLAPSAYAWSFGSGSLSNYSNQTVFNPQISISNSVNTNGNYNNVPFFPRCPYPGGHIVANYPTGWHTIVGNPNQHLWGADKVYSIGNGNYVQCFCPKKSNTDQSTGGLGIQTNWLKASNVHMTVSQMQALGWYYVPESEGWGLPAGGYFAKNSRFICDKFACSSPYVDHSGKVSAGLRSGLSWTDADSVGHAE